MDRSSWGAWAPTGRIPSTWRSSRRVRTTRVVDFLCEQFTRKKNAIKAQFRDWRLQGTKTPLIGKVAASGVDFAEIGSASFSLVWLPTREVTYTPI